jgi:phage terminase small subunit
MPALTKGRLITGKPRLKAPPTLSEGARVVFVATVNAVDPDHFSVVDVPLLAQFCGAADLARRAQQQLDDAGAVTDGKASPWLAVHEKSVRACVALAARLRICPQSRFDRLVAGANSRAQPGGARPWVTDPLLAGYEEDNDPADRFFLPTK